MQYTVTRKDIEKSFRFSVDYHLFPSHPPSNRTTGQSRGLGGVIDSFLVGKVVELAVANIMIKFNPAKDYLLDFEMHSGNERIDDPDIYKIKEDDKIRDPRVYAEIKNVGEDDRWVGLTSEQFNTIQTSRTVSNDLNKVFIIFASIKNKSAPNKKKDDLLGVFLKDEITEQMFKEFTKLEDLIVEIKAIITGKELFEKGINFKKGRYMLETDVFKKQNYKRLMKLIGKSSSQVKPIQISGNTLPHYRFNKKLEYAFEYGDFILQGKAKLFEKNNRQSARVFAVCETDCVIKNKVLGNFYLEKNTAYLFCPATIGRNPVLNRNNIWIAKRNIENISSEPLEERIRRIANAI